MGGYGSIWEDMGVYRIIWEDNIKCILKKQRMRV
jgi:hypothetical protein